MQPGDTLQLRAGTYAEEVNVTIAGVTIQSFANERALITTPTGNPAILATVKIGAAGVTLRNLDITGGYEHAVGVESTGATLLRCRISAGGSDCLQLKPGADSTVVSQCEIFASGQRDPADADGIDIRNSDDVSVRDCHLHDIAAAGICARGGSLNTLIERCLLRDCGVGILLGGASLTADIDTGQNPGYRESIDATARNCIVVDAAGPGVACQAALRPRVQNNTLVNVAEAGGSALLMDSAQHLGTDRSCEDAEFSNNIVGLSATALGNAAGITATGLTGALTMRNNRYDDAGGACSFSDARVPAGWTLAQWQSNLSTDSGSSEGVPGLDAAWHLAAGSPCIGQGFTLSFSDDYDGNSRSGAWDIGADQAGGTPLQTPPASGTFGTGGGAPDLPAAPSNVTAVPYSGQYIAVSWTDNSTIESGFRIERKVGSGSFVTLTTVSANRYASFDPAVQDGVEYTYRVVAVGPSGESAYSNEASAVMVGTPPPPASGGSSGDSGGGCVLGGTGGGWWLLLMLAIIPAAGALRRHA
jgi:hypothetical protein